jgi:hypothetical protein
MKMNMGFCFAMVASLGQFSSEYNITHIVLWTTLHAEACKEAEIRYKDIYTYNNRAVERRQPAPGFMKFGATWARLRATKKHFKHF